MEITTFEDLYTADFELADIFAQRQRWIDGVLFKRERPRKTGAIIYLNGCTGEYTDLETGASFFAPQKSLVYLPYGGKYTVLNIESGKAHPDAYLVEFNIIENGEAVGLSPKPCLIENFNSYLVENIMGEITECFESPNKSPSVLKMKIYELLTSISFKKTNKNESKESAIKPAVEYLKKHPFNAVTVDELAQMCNLSGGGFRRLFKECMGESPKDYISQIKISTAKTLLEESDMSVKEISELLLYDTVAYFCRFFKKKTGFSPLEYRRKK